MQVRHTTWQQIPSMRRLWEGKMAAIGQQREDQPGGLSTALCDHAGERAAQQPHRAKNLPCSLAESLQHLFRPALLS